MNVYFAKISSKIKQIKFGREKSSALSCVQIIKQYFHTCSNIGIGRTQTQTSVENDISRRTLTLMIQFFEHHKKTVFLQFFTS